ncbi:MAG: hypothetical protein VX589_18615 [Myxococcota bacterium]|nr:hypothetical protein [Myxococcota bacterium]
MNPHLIRALFVAVALGGISTTAQAGFSVSAQSALTLCLPSGEADCTETYPGAAVGAAMEVRFWHMGISLDFDYGWAIVGGSGSEDVSSTTMHITPMVKGYYPMGDFDIFFGAGTGYSAMTVADDRTASEASWHTWLLGMKLTAGLVFDLSKTFDWPDGFALDTGMNFFINFGGTRCVKYANAGPCQPVEELSGGQGDVAGQFQLNGALRYTF